MVVVDNTTLFANTYPLEYIKEKYPDFLTRFIGKYVIIGEPDKPKESEKTSITINKLSLEELKGLKLTDKVAKQLIEDRSNEKYITSVDQLKTLAPTVDWSKYNLDYSVQ